MCSGFGSVFEAEFGLCVIVKTNDFYSCLIKQ